MDSWHLSYVEVVNTTHKERVSPVYFPFDNWLDKGKPSVDLVPNALKDKAKYKVRDADLMGSRAGVSTFPRMQPLERVSAMRSVGGVAYRV